MIKEVSEDDLRTGLVKHLVDKGWPRDQADQAFDLALHAAQSAVDVMLATTARADHSLVQLQALTFAMTMLRNKLDHTIDLAAKKSAENGISSSFERV